MTRFGLSRRLPRGVRADDALLDSLSRREEPPAGSDSAVRLLADLSVAADAASPGLGRQAGESSRFVATSERGARPSLAWAAAAAAVAVVAVALGTVVPGSTPGPVPSVQVSPASPASLTHARALVGEAQALLGPAGSLVAPSVRSRARELLGEARGELDRAKRAQEGQPAERAEVEQLIARAETVLTESARGLDGRDDETSGPSPSPTGSDEEDEPKADGEPRASGADSGTDTQAPRPDETSPDD